MPTTLNFPPRIERYCHPCKYLKFVNAVYGHDFVRGDYECHHPKALDDLNTIKDHERAKELAALIGAIQQYGRYIGKKDHQPNWCPLFKTKGE